MDCCTIATIPRPDPPPRAFLVGSQRTTGPPPKNRIVAGSRARPANRKIPAKARLLILSRSLLGACDAWWTLTAVGVALAACTPRIAPGPSTATEAAAPVRVVRLDAEDGSRRAIDIRVAAGTAHEPIGQYGVAAWVADAAGAGGEVTVDREWVSLRWPCDDEAPIACTDAALDALITPRLDERAPPDRRLLDEVHPERLTATLLELALFEGHPYGHPLEGRAGSLAVLGASEARAFHQARYVRGTVVVGLAGDWPEDAHASLLVRLESLSTRRAAPLVLPRPPTLREPRGIIVQRDGATTLRMGRPVVLDTSGDVEAALLLALEVVALGASDRGVAAHAALTPSEDGLPAAGRPRTQPHITLAITAEHAEIAADRLRTVLDVLDALTADGVSEGDLARARATVRARLDVDAAHDDRRLARAVDAVATAAPALHARLGPRLATLDTAAIDAALRAWLAPATLTVVGVSDDATALAARLRVTLPGEPEVLVRDADDLLR